MPTSKAELRRFILQLKNDMSSRSDTVTRLDAVTAKVVARRLRVDAILTCGKRTPRKQG